MAVPKLTGPAVFAAASKRYTTTVELDCTPDQLFDVFEDADSWPLWVPVIRQVEWTSPQPPRVGTTRTVRMVGGLEARERFTAYERGRRMQFVFTSVPTAGVDGFGEDYRVTDLGDGRCRLWWMMALLPAPGVAATAMGLTGWVTGLFLRRSARGLAEYVHTRLPQPT